METGIVSSVEFTVESSHTARAAGSGGLEVLSTPFMIAMMEKAAWTCVQPYLEEGCGTVGTRMEITHEAATPVGVQAVCTAELVEIDGRRLVFRVEAKDGAGRIGGGTHERFIVKNDRFQQKADARLKRD